jgi:hypothetical protein
MKGRIFVVSLVCMALVVAALGIVGCEDAQQSSTWDNNVILFDPPSANISGAGATVVWTVSASTNTPNSVISTNTATGSSASARETVLYLPLAWSVSDPTLGVISSTANFTAIYVSTGKVGNNTIRVEDQAGSAGTTVVEQR